jgi:hypothetical protein
MRARSREVNIFNMSLLDILTGMLGAFLFLMLGLVPYYTKAQKQNNSGGANGPTEPPVDMTLNVISRWDSSSTKVDFFLYGADGWHGSNKKSVPLSNRAKIVSSACPSTDYWQMSSAYVKTGDKFLMCISPQGTYDPEGLRTVRYSTEMMEAQSATDGSGMKSYYPLTTASSYDASGAKPGNVYGVAWYEITKDTSQSTNADDYNLQYNYTYTAVKDGESLPNGAIPLPPPAPVSTVPVTPAAAPTTNSAPVTPPTAPAANADEPAKSSSWNPFNWFHHSTPPEQKQQ